MDQRTERVAKRTREAIQTYRAMRSVGRAAEAPAVVSVIATALYIGARAIDADISTEMCMGLAIGGYGIWRGLRNWWKNRDR